MLAHSTSMRLRDTLPPEHFLVQTISHSSYSAAFAVVVYSCHLKLKFPFLKVITHTLPIAAPSNDSQPEISKCINSYVCLT